MTQKLQKPRGHPSARAPPAAKRRRHCQSYGHRDCPPRPSPVTAQRPSEFSCVQEIGPKHFCRFPKNGGFPRGKITYQPWQTSERWLSQVTPPNSLRMSQKGLEVVICTCSWFCNPLFVHLGKYEQSMRLQKAGGCQIELKSDYLYTWFCLV